MDQDSKYIFEAFKNRFTNKQTIEKNDTTKEIEIKKLIEGYAGKYLKKAIVMSEYAGGGGTNAVQYANGGVMNGDLNINGQILSAGTNIINILSGIDINDKDRWNNTTSTVQTNSASWNTGGALQTLSFNETNYDLSITNGNTIGLSALPESVNVKKFGAKGDGVTNDYASLQAALNSISGSSRLFIPKGTYIISQELRIGSNSYIYGEGLDVTVIKLSNAATASQNVFTNSQNTRSYLTNLGNENIVIKDLTVDGNNGRFPGSYSPGTNTNGCCIGFANVTNAIIENVGAYNAPNHCIDIAASEYAISNDPLVYTPGPSTHIHLKDVKAYGSGDDCITTHYARDILIENCYITGSSGTLVPTNSNGLEIDDGSYDIFVLGGYVKNCIRGIEIKGHATVPAAKRVRVQGLTVENCTRNFDLRHIGFDNGSSKTAFDVQLINCTSLSPVSTETDAALSPRYLKISNYGGVVVRDFTCAGECNTTNLVTIQEGAKDVLIDGLSFQYISGNNDGITDSLLKIDSTALRNITLRNIRFTDCKGLPIYAIGSIPGIVLDGIYGTASIDPASTFLINFSWAPQDVPYTIKNVAINGYLSAYTLGTTDADYPLPKNIEFNENIIPANASNSITVARYGWREGREQGLNAKVGTKIDFTGNIVTGLSSNRDVTLAYIGTEKINATDSDLSSNLVFGTASASGTTIEASNKMLISPSGNVLIGQRSTTDLNSRLTVDGNLSAENIQTSTLTATNLNIRQVSTTAGLSSEYFLTVTVLGSSFKIPLYLP